MNIFFKINKNRFIRTSFHILFLLMLSIIGCEKKEMKNQINFLQEEVDGLEGELNHLEHKYKDLKTKLLYLSSLESELAVMRAKMDSVSQLPATLYSKAHTYFENKEYKECMALLILISEKYPDWDREKIEKKYELAF